MRRKQAPREAFAFVCLENGRLLPLVIRFQRRYDLWILPHPGDGAGTQRRAQELFGPPLISSFDQEGCQDFRRPAILLDERDAQAKVLRENAQQDRKSTV